MKSILLFLIYNHLHPKQLEKYSIYRNDSSYLKLNQDNTAKFIILTMKNTIVWILLIIILNISSSCTIFERFRGPSGFIFKYNGEYTGLDTLINTNGYYQTENFKSNQDNTYGGVMFFTDGLACAATSDNLLPLFSTGGGQIPVVWGSYVISGDTIKVQTIIDLGLMGGMHTNDVKYGYNIIISPNKLKRLIYDHEGFIQEERTYIFHPLESRIDSTNWLLSKKWFWAKEAWINRKK